jgi:hypothetical protein
MMRIFLIEAFIEPFAFFIQNSLIDFSRSQFSRKAQIHFHLLTLYR